MSGSHCFPFADPRQNCCLGWGEGASCGRDSDCLGLMTCASGQCRGDSGCTDYCEREFAGRSINCCVPESINMHACARDEDCLGARTCDLALGVCQGDSGCDTPEPFAGIKVVYDDACLCLGALNTCAFPDGVPCAQRCSFRRVGENASCLLQRGVTDA